MPKQPHAAFEQAYNGIARELVTDILVVPFTADNVPHPELGKRFNFIWDTGATNTVISKRVAGLMALVPTGKSMVHGVHGAEEVNTYFVHLGLPNMVMMNAVRVTDAVIGPDDGGVDGLIGMDVISTGDFCISNHGGKTLFSFAYPCFENKTNLKEKADAVNRRK